MATELLKGIKKGKFDNFLTLTDNLNLKEQIFKALNKGEEVPLIEAFLSIAQQLDLNEEEEDKEKAKKLAQALQSVLQQEDQLPSEEALKSFFGEDFKQVIKRLMELNMPQQFKEEVKEAKKFRDLVMLISKYHINIKELKEKRRIKSSSEVTNTDGANEGKKNKQKARKEDNSKDKDEPINLKELAKKLRESYPRNKKNATTGIKAMTFANMYRNTNIDPKKIQELEEATRGKSLEYFLELLKKEELLKYLYNPNVGERSGTRKKGEQKARKAKNKRANSKDKPKEPAEESENPKKVIG